MASIPIEAVSRTIRRAATDRAALTEVHGLLLHGLERAECAALIATPAGGVLQANGRAEAILGTNDGLALRGGTLAVGHAPARIALVQALAVAGRAGAGPSGGTMAVPRPSGLPHYLLTASPLFPPMHRKMRRRRGLPPEPPSLVLVLIRDPADRSVPDGALLVCAFGLTLAEAEICRRFAAGETPQEIAEARGVGEGSLRQQLKSAMAKLGVTRQAGLMRLLRALPSDGPHLPNGT